MRIHKLKCEQVYLEDILSGTKTFELRYNDRAFQKGDRIELRLPNEPEDFSPTATLEITYVLGGKPWLVDNYVALGIKLLHENNR